MSVLTADRARSLPAALSLRRLESAAVAVAALAFSVVANANLLRPGVVEGDALVHQYWMRRWIDPALFTDALTARLRGSERYPDGYQALFWLASHVTDPIRFGEWLGIALMAAAAWLVFAIVREHSSWRPAAWLAAGLFLALQGHRFFGGFPRGFLHVVVLATVLLAMRRREWAAALVAAGGALFYPPAALLAVGVLILSIRDWRRARTAALAFALMVAAVLGPRLLSGGSFDVMSASEARAYPEFGEHGDLHFFADSLLDYVRQNRSGFDLRATGSLLLLATLGLLAIRRANLRELRPEVLALPVVAVGAWALAQVTLFQLYLPHRYTYPLLAFFAIAVALLLRPTGHARWLVLAPLPLAYLALSVFPLGPQSPPEGVAWWAFPILAALAVAAFAVRRPGAGALLAGVALLVAVLALPGRTPPGQSCPRSPAMAYLATLPKDAVIAGDPMDLKCVPVAANRPVVISTQLAFSYERGYFEEGRARMFASLRAYYSGDAAALAGLRTRYGATHLLVNRRAVRREAAGDQPRWPRARQPYGQLVTSQLSAGEPAVLRRAARCRRWSGGAQAIYDLGCLSR